MSKKVGFTDNPIEKGMEDLFSVEKYIKGLSRFIESCDTPMTIAVQGDWGSGKTSMMNMVKGNLKEKVVPVWFNTWEFSQFSLDEELCITFISYLMKALSNKIKEGKEQKEKRVKEFLVKIKKLSPRVIGTVSGVLSGYDKLGKDVREVLEDIISENSIDTISHLKEEFQGIVNDLLKDKGEDAKVVIFVDDLDRLQPFRAVELLEILKIFLDCENCVYVLAIDYEVVTQGIKEKYPEEMKGHKGKRFFDKIIQVPFKMPVAHYKIEKYVENTLEYLKIGKENAKKYKKIIENSVGCNPRTMKRLFNAYLLLEKVQMEENSEEKGEQTPLHQFLLFSSLCMQMAFENIYNFMVENRNDAVTHELFQEFLREDEDEEYFSSNEDLNKIIIQMNEDKDEEFDTNAARQFLKEFATLLKEESETKNIDEKIIEEFRRVLEMTSTTAISEGNGKSGKGVRYEKVYEKEFKQCTLEDGKVKTFNSCKVEWYQIGDGEKKASASFAEFFVDALAYAYEKNEGRFLELKEDAENNKDNQFRRLFVVEENKNTANKEIPGTGIHVSTYSSNNDKAKQIRKIYGELGLECSCITISLKEAKTVK